MTMLRWPGTEPGEHVVCIVCGSVIPIQQATVGPLFHNERQACMCAAHLCVAQQPALIRAWAKFDAAQRARRASANFEARQSEAKV